MVRRRHAFDNDRRKTHHVGLARIHVRRARSRGRSVAVRRSGGSANQNGGTRPDQHDDAILPGQTQITMVQCVDSEPGADPEPTAVRQGDSPGDGNDVFAQIAGMKHRLPDKRLRVGIRADLLQPRRQCRARKVIAASAGDRYALVVQDEQRTHVVPARQLAPNRLCHLIRLRARAQGDGLRGCRLRRAYAIGQQRFGVNIESGAYREQLLSCCGQGLLTIGIDMPQRVDPTQRDGGERKQLQHLYMEIGRASCRERV